MNTTKNIVALSGSLASCLRSFTWSIYKLGVKLNGSGFDNPKKDCVELKDYFEKTVNPDIQAFLGCSHDSDLYLEIADRLQETYSKMRRFTKGIVPKDIDNYTYDEYDELKDMLYSKYRGDMSFISGECERIIRSLETLQRREGNHELYYVSFELGDFKDALKALSPIIKSEPASLPILEYVLVEVSSSEQLMTLYATTLGTTGVKQVSCHTEQDFSFTVFLHKQDGYKGSGVSLIELLDTYDQANVVVEYSNINHVLYVDINEVFEGRELSANYRLKTISSDEFPPVSIRRDQWTPLFHVSYEDYEETFKEYKRDRKNKNLTADDEAMMSFWDAVTYVTQFNRKGAVKENVHFRINGPYIELVVNTGPIAASVTPFITDSFNQVPMVISVDGKLLNRLKKTFDKVSFRVYLQEYKSTYHLVFESSDGSDVLLLDTREVIYNLEDRSFIHTMYTGRVMFEGKIEDEKHLKMFFKSIPKAKHVDKDDQGAVLNFGTKTHSFALEKLSTYKTEDMSTDVGWKAYDAGEDFELYPMDMKFELPLSSLTVLQKSLAKISGTKSMPFTINYTVGAYYESAVWMKTFVLTMYGYNTRTSYIIEYNQDHMYRFQNYKVIQEVSSELSELENEIYEYDKSLLLYPVYPKGQATSDYEPPKEWMDKIQSLDDSVYSKLRRYQFLYTRIADFIIESKGLLNPLDFADFKLFEPAKDLFSDFKYGNIGDHSWHRVTDFQDHIKNMTLEEALDHMIWGWWAEGRANKLRLEKESRDHRTVEGKKSYKRVDFLDYLDRYGFDYEVIDEQENHYKVRILGDDKLVLRGKEADKQIYGDDLKYSEALLVSPCDKGKIVVSRDRLRFY